MLTLVYNLLTGGDTLHAINRLRSDGGLRRMWAAGGFRRRRR